MELKIYKKPNPLKVFDKVSKLKKLLKPIKVKNSEDFIDELLSKPQEILTLLFDGFSAKDYSAILNNVSNLNLFDNKRYPFSNKGKRILYLDMSLIVNPPSSTEDSRFVL